MVIIGAVMRACRCGYNWCSDESMCRLPHPHTNKFTDIPVKVIREVRPNEAFIDATKLMLKCLLDQTLGMHRNAHHVGISCIHTNISFG